MTVIEWSPEQERFRKHEVTWEAPPSHIPPPQPLLPIEEAGEGGEESDDDVEAAEVWPLMGRGVPHVRVKRKNGEVALGRAGSEAGSGGEALQRAGFRQRVSLMRCFSREWQ